MRSKSTTGIDSVLIVNRHDSPRIVHGVNARGESWHRITSRHRQGAKAIQPKHEPRPSGSGSAWRYDAVVANGGSFTVVLFLGAHHGEKQPANKCRRAADDVEIGLV